MTDSIRVLGSRVDRAGTGQALARIGELLETPELSQVITLNPEYVMLARRSPELRRIINSSALSVPDGIGIVWASRLMGEALPGRVTGTGLLPEICRLAAGSGAGVFFIGGSPGVAEMAAAELKRRFPDLIIAGTSSHDPNPEADKEIAAEIERSGARVLAVAYGCPKQDYWIDANRQRLGGVRLAIGIGGALDFISGQTPRAPRWMRKAGLEWLYRLWLEPRRLGRMTALPRFALLVAAEKIRGRRG